MDERASCLTCGTARAAECSPEHPAREALGDEYRALHRVFLAAHRLTWLGQNTDEAMAELESAVSEAMDALPYHLKGPA